MAVGGARLGGLQQLQMPPREDLNLPEEGPPESARAGAGPETPPEGTEQEVSLDKFDTGGEGILRLLLGGLVDTVCADKQGKWQWWLVVGWCVSMGSGEVPVLQSGPIFKVDAASATKWAPPFFLQSVLLQLCKLFS